MKRFKTIFNVKITALHEKSANEITHKACFFNEGHKYDIILTKA